MFEYCWHLSKLQCSNMFNTFPPNAQKTNQNGSFFYFLVGTKALEHGGCTTCTPRVLWPLGHKWRSFIRASTFTRYYVRSVHYESYCLHQNTAECNFCGVFFVASISSLKVYVISGSCILFCNLLAISMGCFFAFTAK